MNIALPLLVLTAGMISPLVSQEEPTNLEASKLVKLRSLWTAAKDRTHLPHDQEYGQQLRTLLKRLAEKGELDNAMEVRKELERFSEDPSPTPILANDLESLSKLKKEWVKLRSRSVEPINKRYHIELKKLVSALTKAGSFDEALLAKKELKALESEKFIAATYGKTFTEILSSYTWDWKREGSSTDIGRLKFKESGHAEFSVHRKNRARWRIISGRQISIEVDFSWGKETTSLTWAEDFLSFYGNGFGRHRRDAVSGNFVP